MVEQPLFSIAIPTYNRLEYLKKAVGSALNQTYQNIEIVVLNNASIDGTKEYLDKISKTDNRIKVVNHKRNLGCVENIKNISKHVSGKYLNVLSDDDCLETTFVKEAVHDLDADDTATVWYCRAKIIDENGKGYRLTKRGVRREDGKNYERNYLFLRRETQFVSTVYRLATVKKINCFDSYTIYIDQISRALCALEGYVLYNDKVLCSYRMWLKNTVSLCDMYDALASMMEIYNKLPDKKFFRSSFLYNVCHVIECSVAHRLSFCKFIRVCSLYSKKFGFEFLSFLGLRFHRIIFKACIPKVFYLQLKRLYIKIHKL